jgi:HrpA-like RNA helicase
LIVKQVGFEREKMADYGGKGFRIKPSIVDEEYKIQISKRVNEFRESDEQLLVFPKGLDNQERKYVHEICMKLGLQSKSIGTGESRYLTVRKPIEAAAMNERLPVILLLKSCQAELERYFSQCPLTEAEIDFVTGKSAKPFVNNALLKNAKRQAFQKGSASVAEKSATKNPHVVPPIIASRKKLPIWSHQQEIVDCIGRSSVTIVSGETGSGKSSKLTTVGSMEK